MEKVEPKKYNLLKAFFKYNEIKYNDVSKLLNIHSSTFKRKINKYNNLNFNDEEKQKIIEFYRLPQFYFYENKGLKREEKGQANIIYSDVDYSEYNSTKKQNNEYLTINEYLELNNIDKDSVNIQVISKQAIKESKSQNKEIKKIYDKKYKKLNTYHINILKQVINN